MHKNDTTNGRNFNNDDDFSLSKTLLSDIMMRTITILNEKSGNNYYDKYINYNSSISSSSYYSCIKLALKNYSLE